MITSILIKISNYLCYSQQGNKWVTIDGVHDERVEGREGGDAEKGRAVNNIKPGSEVQSTGFVFTKEYSIGQ